ncbi:hypothetical protein J437_LFUL018837 [Ladona fulva]|uniref:Glycerate kinase n=1 Tax=Ladona fulva TaxID=123851 RepID=A0A8K0P9Q0_LADFU|nr:hypothetical protein J437_LFUL018837 [Ladona fulva]
MHGTTSSHISYKALHLKEKMMGSNMEFLKLISRTIFHCGVQSALPNKLVKKCVKREGNILTVAGKQYTLKKNCYVVGFGKAVLAMTSELERILGDHLIGGTISIPEGIFTSLSACREVILHPQSVVNIYEGAKNNLPDENAEEAAASIKTLVQELDSSAILFVTVSGGGSALLPSPVPPLTLEDKLEVTKLLSKAGATINELNSVRKSLSVLKGGGLARLAYPAQVISLILSDVVDDPLDSIASGPTVVNTDTCQTTVNILKKYSLEEKIPWKVWEYVKKNSEIKSPTDDIPITNGQYSHVQNCLIGNNYSAIQNVARRAGDEGYHAVILSSTVEGNVRELAKLYALFSLEVCRYFGGETTEESLVKTMKNTCKALNIPMRDLLGMNEFNIPNNCRQLVLVSGGEATVEVKGTGVGGRNQELALAFAYEFHQLINKCSHCQDCDILFLSGGSDGMDGPTRYAGAISYPQQMTMARNRGMDVLSYLDNNDSTNFFLNLNNGEDLLITGHTGTNVMDVHMLIVNYFKK